MDALGGKDMRPDRLDEGHPGCRRRPPIGQYRHIEIDAYPLIEGALAI